MPIKLANNAIALVPSAVSSTQTTVTVAAGKGALFPILGSSDYFYATLTDLNNNYEIVKVTARTDDVMTVVRAQESTLAIPFSANSRFELRVTAASVREIGLASVLTVNATGNGSQVLFVVPTTPAAVYINGVYQNRNTYSFGPGGVTFSQAPPLNSVIEFLV
jgi:hypothetical protein